LPQTFFISKCQIVSTRRTLVEREETRETILVDLAAIGKIRKHSIDQSLPLDNMDLATINAPIASAALPTKLLLNASWPKSALANSSYQSRPTLSGLSTSHWRLAGCSRKRGIIQNNMWQQCQHVHFLQQEQLCRTHGKGSTDSWLKGIVKGLKIQGQGCVLWAFHDRQGQLQLLKIPAYSVPNCRMHLLSTTSLPFADLPTPMKRSSAPMIA
jgi:hypothetical protein